jgi:hypothetical protein
MDVGMDMRFPVGKANWRCDTVGIHCGTHPVGMKDGRKIGDEGRVFNPDRPLLNAMRALSAQVTLVQSPK